MDWWDRTGGQVDVVAALAGLRDGTLGHVRYDGTAQRSAAAVPITTLCVSGAARPGCVAANGRALVALGRLRICSHSAHVMTRSGSDRAALADTDTLLCGIVLSTRCPGELARALLARHSHSGVPRCWRMNRSRA